MKGNGTDGKESVEGKLMKGRERGKVTRLQGTERKIGTEMEGKEGKRVGREVDERKVKSER